MEKVSPTLQDAAPEIDKQLQTETSAIYVDPVIERRALRKFDLILIPQILIVFILGALDRSNIGNAKIFGFTTSLNLVGNDFNNVSTVFYATYIFFEAPWVMAIKKFGINIVLGTAMVGWSVVTLGTGFVETYGQAIACRVLLGLFEGGLLPCLIYAISMIWSRNHQSKRISAIYVAGAISGAFGGLFAWGVQSRGTYRGLLGWRWLFIVEGILSSVFCLMFFFTMPRSAESAWFLTGKEKEVMRARKERDAIYKGTEDKLRWTDIKEALIEPYVWLGGIVLFANSTATLGFSVFLPTILSGMGYTTLQANYLTIPVFSFVAICVFFCAFFSDRLKSRAIPLMIIPIPTIIGYAMAIGSANKVVGYVAMYLCGAGMFCFSTVLLAWISINISPDYKRSVGIPIMGMLGNCAGLLASQIYPASGAPRYVSGNAISMAMEVVAWIGVLLMYILLRYRNSQKEKLRAQGLTTNNKVGDRALDFVYYL